MLVMLASDSKIRIALVQAIRLVEADDPFAWTLPNSVFAHVLGFERVIIYSIGQDTTLEPRVSKCRPRCYC